VAALAPDRALVFIGFMGAGKTAAAREVAAALGVRALDSDRMLEDRLGYTVEEAFARHGEAGFRAEEERLCTELLGRARAGDVISLGGGAILSEATRTALARHTTVLVDVDVETAWSRAAGRGRPLARERAAFEALYASRESLYLALADAILPARERGTARRALPWLLELAEGVRLLWGTARSASYPVLIGRRALQARPWPAAGRRFVISDEAVAPLHGARIGEAAARLAMPPGEEHKTLTVFERLQRELARAATTTSSRWAAAWSAMSPGSAPRPTSAASRSCRSRRRWWRRSTRPTAARPASTCPRARTTSAPTTSPPACSSTWGCSRRCRRPSAPPGARRSSRPR